MIEIIRRGIYTSIQDAGRFNYQNIGVPISGPMDQQAFGIANQILNNAYNTAVLECSFMGPKIKFHKNTYISLAGAEMNTELNGEKIKSYTPYKVNKGDILSMGTSKYGCRTYLSISGGIKTEKVLGSRSQFKGITSEGNITKKVFIPIGKSDFIPKVGVMLKPINIDYENEILEVYPGPEFKILDNTQKKFLLDNVHHISSLNNRMAFRLEEKLICKLPEIWTSPIIPGTIQCTPDGSLIIIMRDGQVTGGYPRIFQLNKRSINLLSQKTTRSTIRFKLLSKV